MTQTDILTEIKQQQEKGYSEDIIRANLLTSGFSWPDIDAAFSNLSPQTTAPLTSTAPQANPTPAKPKKRFPLLKTFLILFFFGLIGTGGFFAYQYLTPSETAERLPPEEESRDYIYQITTRVLDHISQSQYHEALSYFHYQKQNPVFDESILTSLAVIKVAYQQPDGSINYQLNPENIVIDGETAEVTIQLVKDNQPHSLYLDFHYSNWYITDIRFESQLDYLSLSRSEPVIQELFSQTQFQQFLPSYSLNQPDTLSINLVVPDTGPPSLTFQTPHQPQNNYLISIFELPDQQTHIPVVANQPFNFSHILTTQSYGVIYVFSSTQDPTNTESALDQLTPSNHRLRLTFRTP